jgi:hypothetical protein
LGQEAKPLFVEMSQLQHINPEERDKKKYLMDLRQVL